MKKDALPASIFGWPGTMSRNERLTCEMSLAFNPTGTTVLQMTAPDEFPGEKGSILCIIRVYASTPKEKTRKFGFIIERDSSEAILWPKKIHDFNEGKIPADLASKCFRVYTEWKAANKSLLQPVLQDQKQEEDPLLVQRLQVYIRSIGRQHAGISRTVCPTSHRRIIPGE